VAIVKFREQAISDMSSDPLLKLHVGLVHNLSYENEFYLHVNENSFPYEWLSVLSVSFEVTGCITKVGGWAIERRRCEILGGSPENFETWMLGTATTAVFQEVFFPNMARKTRHKTVRI